MPSFLPYGKAGGLQIRRCQGFAVGLLRLRPWRLGSEALRFLQHWGYSDGYGSYDRMGEDPDAVLLYGRHMMRYGFHEHGMPGGSDKYPGYNRNLDNNTIKKMNAEQEAFIKATENFRQTIYEKELYLKAELAKKKPDKVIALQFQNAISEARGKYEQIMIEHIIRMKKINLEAEK